MYDFCGEYMTSRKIHHEEKKKSRIQKRFRIRGKEEKE